MATWDERTALRPGAAVRHGGEEYVIERTIHFDQVGGGGWIEHRLSSDGSGRSLWLEVPDDPAAAVVAYAHSAVLDTAPDGTPAIEHDGETVPLLATGRARYRSVERGPAPKQGEVRFSEYAGDDRRISYENRGDEKVWEMSVGREIDAADIEIVA